LSKRGISAFTTQAETSISSSKNVYDVTFEPTDDRTWLIHHMTSLTDTFEEQYRNNIEALEQMIAELENS
jgi:hypothetical protein